MDRQVKSATTDKVVRIGGASGSRVQGPAHRYELPGIHAISLVCERALGGVGMASLRNDPLGKGMAQMLLDMPVDVPTGLQELPA